LYISSNFILLRIIYEIFYVSYKFDINFLRYAHDVTIFAIFEKNC